MIHFFNLYSFFLIFTFVNKKFSIVFDWRLIPAILAVVLFMSIFLNKKYIFKTRLISIFLIVITVIIGIVTTIFFYEYNISHPQNSTNTVIISYMFIFINFIVISFYWKYFNVRKFMNYYFFSLLFLLFSVILDFFRFPIHLVTIYDAYGHGKDIFTDGMYRASGWVYGPNIVPLVTIPYVILIFALKDKFKYLKTIILSPSFILPLSKTFFIAIIISLFYYFLSLNKKLFYFTVVVFSFITLYIISIYYEDLLLVPSMSFRFIIWENSFDKILDNLLGHGAAGSRYFSLPYQYGTIHNTYLAIIGDFGIIGLCTYLYLIIRTYYINSKPYKIGFIILILYGFTQEYAFSLLPVLYFYVTYRIIYEHQQKRKVNDNNSINNSNV